MKRKIGVIVTAILIAFVCVGTVSAKKQKKYKPLKIGFETGGLCPAPVHIAIKNGLFDEEFGKIGQTYELVDFTTGASQAELIASGKLDAAFNLTATLMQPIDNGLPIAFVTGLHTGCTKYYVRADSDIKTLQDFKGKRIGVLSLSDSSVMHLQRRLDDVGLTVQGENRDFELLVYAQEDLPIALEKDAVDIIALHDPVAARAEENYNVRKILDIATDEKLGKEYCCQAFVTRKVIKENPEAAAAFARAMQKAAAFVKVDPRAAAQIQLDNNLVSGDIEFNTRLLSSYDYTASVALGKKSFEDAARQLQTFGAIKKTTNIDKYLRESFVVLKDVPDRYEYDPVTNTYTAIYTPLEHR